MFVKNKIIRKYAIEELVIREISDISFLKDQQIPVQAHAHEQLSDSN